MKLNNFFLEKLNRTPDGSPSGNPPANGAGAGGDPGAAALDLSFIPQDYHKDGQPDLPAFSAHYQDLIARDAQMAERLAGVPEAYDFTIPDGLTFEGLDLPEGFRVDLDKDNPLMAPLFEELGGFLKEVGAPAAAAGKISSLIAKYEAAKYSQSNAALKAEMAALGTPAQQQARLGAVDRLLQTRLPQAQAAALKDACYSAEGVKALEALLRPGGHTAPPSQPTKPDTEGLSPLDRLKLANAKT